MHINFKSKNTRRISGYTCKVSYNIRTLSYHTVPVKRTLSYNSATLSYNIPTPSYNG